MKTIYVSSLCVSRVPKYALVLNQDMLVDEATQRFAEQPASRSIFLVDDENMLVGVVNSHDILNWVRLQLNLTQNDMRLSLATVRRTLHASRVRDLAMPGSSDISVSLNDTLQDVVLRMSRYDLVDMPVLDEQGRLVGDISLRDILAHIVLNETCPTDAA